MNCNNYFELLVNQINNIKDIHHFNINSKSYIEIEYKIKNAIFIIMFKSINIIKSFTFKFCK